MKTAEKYGNTCKTCSLAMATLHLASASALLVNCCSCSRRRFSSLTKISKIQQNKHNYLAHTYKLNCLADTAINSNISLVCQSFSTNF